MDDYRIRKATPDDYSFISRVIIGAEKGNTGKLSYSALFNLDENSVKELIISMLEEDIDGCEFSPSSYLIAEYNGESVAALGAWIECFNGNLPSKILKSNLLNYFLEEKQIKYLNSKSAFISDIVIEREKNTLQFEYVYVARLHRGRELHVKLVNEHLKNAFSIYPKLHKAQLQVFKNNFVAIKAYEEIGYEKVRSSISNSIETLEYLPYNEKTLMEKNLNPITNGKD
jgi:ribosomal protein S18 acetylase RimI-like enzyme